MYNKIAFIIDSKTLLQKLEQCQIKNTQPSRKKRAPQNTAIHPKKQNQKHPAVPEKLRPTKYRDPPAKTTTPQELPLFLKWERVWEREKLLFPRKEVSPFPKKPHPSHTQNAAARS
ncbi:MAG: hypothetical protein J6S90_01950 [Lentisphaeria bacterium]|nr:hypothetical protein [Lentisphaeria bacterium]